MYIGITSQKLGSRFRHNGIGYKKCTYFYNALQKYGWDNFDHIMLAKRLSEQDARDIERRVIFQLKSEGYNLYNLMISDIDCHSYKHSDETIEKIRKAHLGIPKSMEHRQKISQGRMGKFVGENNPNFGKHLSAEAKKRIGDTRRGERNYNYGRTGRDTTASKSVLQFDNNMAFLDEYPSISEASRQTGVGLSGISKCCNKQFKQSGGYIWRFKTDIE